MKFQIYKSGALYYWRLKAGNGEIIAQGEGYARKEGAQNAINLVKNTTVNTTVEDLT